MMAATEESEAGLDWLHLFGRSREDQACFPELDQGHVAKRRAKPEAVAPMHAVRKLDLQLARRAERLAVDELGLQRLVGRLVDRVVVRAPLPRQRPLDVEDVEHLVDLRVAELAAADAVWNASMSEIGNSSVAKAALTRAEFLRGPVFLSRLN